MAKTLLISQSTLQSKSIINDNVDWEMIKPVVEVVQDLYLQKIIGTDLFVKLQTDVDNYITSSTPIPVNYKLLLDNYITDYLCWMVVAHSGNVIKYRYMNKGVMEKNSENSQPISDEQFTAITKTWLNYAEQYGEQLIKYINNNTTLYPEYTSNSGSDDTPNGMAFDSPFIFPIQQFNFEVEQKDYWNKC